MKVFVVTHGLLAEGLVNSAELIIGEHDNIKYFSLTAEKNINDFKEEVEKEVLDTSEDVLCLTDIVNGSPFNIISTLVIEYSHVYHVSGVNLGMILEAVLSTGVDVDELIDKLIESGKSSIFDAGAYIKEKLREEI